MGTKRVNISLPTATLERLNSSIPQGKKSEFITQAIDEKFGKKLSLKEEIIRDLKENAHIYEEVRKDWSVLDNEGWPEYDWNEDSKR